MKKIPPFLIIILMILSLSISINIPDNEIDEISMIDYLDNNKNQISEKQSEEFKFREGEFAIFANNEIEFNEIKQLENIIKIYPNLKAIKIYLDYATYNDINKKYQEIYPSELFIIKHEKHLYDQRPYKSNLKIDSRQDIDKLNIGPLWDLGYNGTGVVVAVLDNGVDFTHPSLIDAKNAAFDISTDDTYPCKDHGTPVAGSVAARSSEAKYQEAVGTAPGAKIFSLEAGCGSEGAIYFDQLEAFELIFKYNNTIDIVNTSLGTSARTNELFNKFVSQLDDLNITLVGSAGNEGIEGDRSIYAAYGNTVWGISVAASTYSDRKASFSSIGPGYGFNQKPDVIAPGQDVIAVQTPDASDGERIVSIDGTSFSSPTTAGALATLLSALRDRGYITNPGLLKAALMRGSNPITNNINSEGFGLPDIENTMLLIDDLELGTDGVPRIIEMTPKNGPVGLIEYIPQNAVSDITYTLISSHPLDTEFTFGGDLNGIAGVKPLVNDYSQYVKITVDTNGLEENSEISGTITATNGKDNVTVSLTINIGESYKGKIAFDRYHTYWDFTMGNVMDGTNTGEIINMAMKKGWQVIEINEKITPELLNNFDMLWMPDTLNAISRDDLYIELDSGIFEWENFIKQSEIDAIHDFVSDGNDLLFVFNGILGDDGVPTQNATAINKLLSKFDIKAVSEPMNPPSNAYYIDAINKTSLVNGVEKLTHYGNYLEISGSALPFTMDRKGRVSGAVYSNIMGGNVLVASSNFWMDNYGVKAKYDANAQGQEFDAILSEQMWDWFSRENVLIKQSDKFENNVLSGSFLLVENGEVIKDAQPKVYLRESLYFGKTNLDVVSDEQGLYSFEYAIDQYDGFYEIVAEYGDDYISYTNIFVDNTPPYLIFSESNPNGTAYEVDTESFILEFEIGDLISEIDKNDVSLSVDGEPLDAISSFNKKSGIYRASISVEPFSNIENDLPNYIEITLTDDYDNTKLYIYEFYIGKAPIKTETSTTETSTTETSTTISNSTITTMTNSSITTSEQIDGNETSIEITSNENTEELNLPISFSLIILSLCLIPYFKRKLISNSG